MRDPAASGIDAMRLLPPRHRMRARTWRMPLVFALAAAAAPAAAQDTTVVGSGGPESGVTVNLNVLDNGGARGTGGSPQRSRGTGQQLQLQPPDQGEPDRAGASRDRGAGPSGRVLLFPPMEHPRSRLLVDPDAMAAQGGDQAGQAQTATAPTLREPGTRDGRGRATDGGQTPQSRESGMTSQGKAMAESGGADNGMSQDGGRGASTSSPQSAASADGVPDAPDLPDAPSTEGAAGNRPDPVTPDTKPEPADRDTGDPSMARDGDDPTAGDTEMAEAGAGQSGSSAANTGRDSGTGTDTTGAASGDSTSAGADMGSGRADTGTAASDAGQTGEPQTGTPQTGEAQTGEPQAAETQPAEPDTGASGTSGSQTGETQTAKRTPAAGALPGKMQLDFETGSAKLSDSARATLTDLASTLEENADARIQLMAYAKGGDDGASRARRLSLSRALAVRSFLIDRGVRSTRMDVRALGDTAKDGPLDRVDIVPAGG